MRQTRFFILLVLTFVVGCNFLPQVGPKYSQLTYRSSTSETAKTDYELVRINAIVAEETRIGTSQSLAAEFVSTPEFQPDELRRGDVVSILIWEPIPGLFQIAGGRETLPHLVIDDRGEVFIPFIGTLKAEGLELRELRALIAQKLAKQTPDPQVLVTLDKSERRAVSIQGDIKNSGRYQLERGLTRLLPLLAVAGGPTGRPEITEILVRRGANVGEVWLDEIYGNPSYNIALVPGDLILLRQSPIRFNAMGLVNRTGRIVADGRDVSLLKALNLVGGLDVQSGDATGVFVFREEQPSIIGRLAQRDQLESVRANRPPMQEFVYLLDMSQGDSVFFAERFQVREGDTLYVTNAPADDWRKVLSIVVPTITLPRAVTPTTGVMAQ